jgi:hypothetical protein
VRAVKAAALVAVVGAFSAGSASAAGTAFSVQVTNANDAGAGSFRAAVDKANTDTNVGKIVFRFGLAPVALAEPVEYTGSQSLIVVGNGAVLDGGLLASDDAAAFLARGGGNLSVSLLTVRNAPHEGLTYQVPADATGIKKVSLVGLKIVDNKGHGVLINDQAFPDEAGDPDATPPIPPNPAGSDASVDVTVTGCSFENNGRGALDRDGLRVNEGGLGDLTATVTLTKVERNGGDGVELDERGDGGARFVVSGSQITLNGDFDTATDPDDGMDVDESGNGSVIGRVLASSASRNHEEGLDINENDAGDLRFDATAVDASGNFEEGVDLEEDDDFPGGGDLVATLVGIKTDTNAGGDAGLKIREKDVGNLTATVRATQANGNQADGIQIREDATGNLVATVDRSTASGNTGDGIELEENSTGDLNGTVEKSTTNGNGQDGVEFDENGDGNLTASARRGSSATNTGAGVAADQAFPGAGTLSLVAMLLDGNGGGPFVATNVTVTQGF